MTELAQNYAQALFELGTEEAALLDVVTILKENPLLQKALNNPTIQKSEKFSIIDTIFQKPICNSLKVFCEHGRLTEIFDIYEALRKLSLNQRNAMEAELLCVQMPSKDQIQKAKTLLQERYHKEKVLLQIKADPQILGGCIITVGHTVYDKSIRTVLLDLQTRLKKR